MWICNGLAHGDAPQIRYRKLSWEVECIWQHRFERFNDAKAASTAWVKHYNETRPHSGLGYLPPAEWRRRQGELGA